MFIIPGYSTFMMGWLKNTTLIPCLYGIQIKYPSWERACCVSILLHSQGKGKGKGPKGPAYPEARHGRDTRGVPENGGFKAKLWQLYMGKIRENYCRPWDWVFPCFPLILQVQTHMLAIARIFSAIRITVALPDEWWVEFNRGIWFQQMIFKAW